MFLGVVITAALAKVATVLGILGVTAISGIGIRGGWLILSWCMNVLKTFILKNIFSDPDILMKKNYFVCPSPAFNESAYIMHEIRRNRDPPGSFEEVTIKPSGKSIHLELPLERVPWSFEIEIEEKEEPEDRYIKKTNVVVELYLRYLPGVKKICVWASEEQCAYIKKALKAHYDNKRT